MSKIFEITHRDAASRIGKLTLDEKILTPTIHKKDSFIIDSGSIWKNSKIPEYKGKKIVILPNKSTSLNTRLEIIKQFHEEKNPEKTECSGIVIHPSYQVFQESDMYVLGSSLQLENNARKFVSDIIHLKENIRADSLLYVPTLATPMNLSMLVYLGVDIVDETLSIIKGYQDIFLTNSGEYYLDRLHEFPCSCQVCLEYEPKEFLKLPKKERSELLSKHNILKLNEEMKTIRENIRLGSLREYIERQCRVSPWLTAALRFIDFEYNFLEKRTPIFRSNTLYANTSESLNRVEIKRFAKRIIERYKAPKLDTLVLLPCSAKKPYSTSLSHQRFINALGKYRKYVHEVIITSPVGIVPRELELMYPASHYDTPVTGYWDKEERNWVSGCLKSYLLKNKYKNIIAHLDGAYKEICEDVESELGLEFIYTSEDSVTSYSSLDTLNKVVSEFESDKKRTSEEMKLDLISSTLDYQFGIGASDILVSDDAVVKAPFPKFQLYSSKKQLATLISQYGTLALTLEGGLRLSQISDYKVIIGDFIPHSSILAPGIIDSDVKIRPNDEVMVIGEKVFGVGRSLMSGWEMKQCSKGVAVELRHVKSIN